MMADRGNAVGLCDLDVREPRVGEVAHVFVVGKRAGDAADELRDVGAGGIVHGRVGDDVGDGEAPAGAQHARDLPERVRGPREAADQVRADDVVERVVAVGETVVGVPGEGHELVRRDVEQVPG